jgi:hypothetical protein
MDPEDIEGLGSATEGERKVYRVFPVRLREKFEVDRYDRLSNLRRRITDGAAVHSLHRTKP